MTLKDAVAHIRPFAALIAPFVVAALLRSPPASADETFVVTDPAPGSVAPYVPTVEEDVELMLDVAGVGPGDYVIDLGSGDGRIVIAAARRGALAHGVEIEPELVELAARNARDAGVAGRTAFVEGDIFAADVADASVVTLYLFPEANIALRPKLLAELAPGTRIVSNSFDMGEWRPDVHDTSARSSGGILLWVVPADVGGEWTIEIDGADPGAREAAEQITEAAAEQSAGPAAGQGTELAAGQSAERATEQRAEPSGERYALHVAQTYQDIDLTLASPGAPEPMSVVDATLRGDRIAFRVEASGRSYAFGGRVDGDTMSGHVHIQDADGTRLRRWRATR